MIMSRQSGFTLIELIMIIFLISILAIYATPKLNLSNFRESGFFLQAISAVRYAQKQAIASGCHVEVDVNASGCYLSWSNPVADAACPADAASITNPADNNTNFCNDSTPAANPVGGNFRFDEIGRPTNTSDNLLTTAQDIGISTRTIRVEAETGYTHEN